MLASGTNDYVTNSIGSQFVPKAIETFGYDADGNQTNDGRWTLTWDGENRLVQMQSLSGAPVGSSNRLTFAYDQQGRRISKVTELFASGAWSIALSNRFVYDGWNLVAELNATNNAVINSFMWGLDLSGTMQGAGGVGGLLAINATNAGSHFCGYDGNGDVTVLVSASSGVTTPNYEYDPFGNVLRATGPLALINPFRFSTKYTDAESAFFYYGYRSYNSAAGRWLNRDPLLDLAFVASNQIKNRESRPGNAYCFVFNSAIGGYDFLGLVQHELSPPCVLGNTVGCALFEGFSQTELEDFAPIREDGTTAASPVNGLNCGLDGFWWRGSTQWYKIPGFCRVKVRKVFGGDGFVTESCCDRCLSWACRKFRASGCTPGFYPDAGDTQISPSDYPF